jgi:hypothetical protein
MQENIMHRYPYRRNAVQPAIRADAPVAFAIVFVLVAAPVLSFPSLIHGDGL